jgi:UDP-glucose 4-epimerase
MKVFVTGGAGYIGSHTVRLLVEAGHTVRVFDNLSEGHPASVPERLLFEGDLLDDRRLDEGLAGGYDCVMHFAASCSVGESMTSPEKYYTNNTIASLHLLAAMRRAGVLQIVFSSSAATYGNPAGAVPFSGLSKKGAAPRASKGEVPISKRREMAAAPITEDHPTEPINVYGRTKLDFEHTLAAYAEAYNLGYACLRYFNAAGAAPDGTIGEDHRPEGHLIPLVLEVALGQRLAVGIFGTDYPTPDGTCVRDYIHVYDLAQAHILAMEAIQPGTGLVFNLGNGAGYSVRAVIETARAVTGKPIAVTEGPRRPGDPAILVASSEKIARDLGWRPKLPKLEQIIETAWRWHRDHPEGYGE